MKCFPARIVAVLAALAAVLFVAACSSPASDGHADHEQSAANSTADTSTVATKPADFNDADVSFVTDMIPHHEQAVTMSALVPDRSTNPEVVKLAAEISAAQGPEIETMKVFLVQWTGGEAPPDPAGRSAATGERIGPRGPRHGQHADARHGRRRHDDEAGDAQGRRVRHSCGCSR